MSIMTIAINDPTLAKKSAEVAYVQNAVAIALTEFGRGQGTVTSGVIRGMNSAGVANSSLGSWTYVPSAALP